MYLKLNFYKVLKNIVLSFVISFLRFFPESLSLSRDFFDVFFLSSIKKRTCETTTKKKLLPVSAFLKVVAKQLYHVLNALIVFRGLGPYHMKTPQRNGSQKPNMYITTNKK